MELIKKEENNYNTIQAIEKDKVVGYINYCLKSNHKAWLFDIAVDKEYRKKGIGTILLHIFENDCLDNYIKVIEGKFYPHDEEGDIVRDFYKKKWIFNI